MSLVKLISTTGLALVAFVAAQAAPITGNYGFSGGTVTLDTTTVNTATQVATWNSPVGNEITFTAGSGTLASANGSLVTLFQPWNFVSGAVNNFFSAGNFTFDLISSSIVNQGAGFLTVGGTGIMRSSVAGQDPTEYTFRFSTQDPETTGGSKTFTFSASGNPTPNRVPDGGTTALLLSVGLIGMSVLAHRRSVKR